MIEFIKRASTWLIVPVLFAGHFLTGHFAFLFVYAAMCVVTGAGTAFLTFIIFKLSDSEQFQDKIAEAAQKLGVRGMFITGTYTLLPLIYLFFFEFYGVAALALISGIAIFMFNLSARELAKVANERKAKEAAVLSDGI